MSVFVGVDYFSGEHDSRLFAENSSDLGFLLRTNRNVGGFSVALLTDQ